MSPILEPILPSHLDSTMLTTFRSCPRKFQNEFIYGLHPLTKSVDLHAGGCFAAALDTFYRTWHHTHNFDRSILWAMDTFNREWGDFIPPEKHPKTFTNVWTALVDYVNRYHPKTDVFQPLIVNGEPTSEFTFAIPLMPEDGFPLHPETHEPFLYAGAMDQVGLYAGLPAICDAKSTRSFTDTWLDKWPNRPQFMGYHWAAQETGLFTNPQTLVRGIAILKTEIQHRECVLSFADHQIDDWYRGLKYDLHRIVDMWTSSYFHKNSGDSCTSFNKPCTFQDLCIQHDDDMERWLTKFVVRRWNPLDRNPLRSEYLAET